MVQRITEVNGLRAGRDLVNLVKGKIQGGLAASPKMVKTRMRGWWTSRGKWRLDQAIEVGKQKLKRNRSVISYELK